MRRLFLGLAIASIAALSPCWALADDQQIAQQIVQQLRQHKAEGRLNGFGIDLEVESGIVWLKGHVTTAEQQQLVLDATQKVEGVTQVVNDLEIKAAPPAKTETAKTEPAKTETAKRPGQMLSNLKGNVKRALGGDKSVAQPKTVVQTAAQTRTVSETRPAAPSDEELAETVIGRLRSQKERGTLRNFDVDVQVDGRVVWISGRVASPEQQSLVLDVACRVPGVKEVVNDLQIANQAPVQTVSAPVSAPVSVPSMVPVPQAQVPVMVPVQSQGPAPLPYAQVQGPQVPRAFAPAQSVQYQQPIAGQPIPEVPAAGAVARARFDNPSMPGYAWPSYAAYPNYAAVTYPKQYSPTAWPYIGPFYPYPQVPLGWRKVTMEWDDGWWWLDFKSK